MRDQKKQSLTFPLSPNPQNQTKDTPHIEQVTKRWEADLVETPQRILGIHYHPRKEKITISQHSIMKQLQSELMVDLARVLNCHHIIKFISSSPQRL